MEDVDIGNPSPAVYMHLESDPTGRPVAFFVSQYGDTFCLERWQIKSRIVFLKNQGRDIREEQKALAALALAGG